MADSNLSLREAVEKAAAEQGITEDNPEQSSHNEEIKPNKKQDPPAKSSSESKEDEDGESGTDEKGQKADLEDKTEEEPEELDDAEAEEIQQALSILRALKDPKTQKDLVKDFAVRLGLISETQDLSKKDEKDLSTLITDELGQDYPDLKESITKIAKAIEDKTSKEIKSLKEELAAEKRANAEKSFTEEYTTFLKTNKISEAESALMLKEMKELPPGSNITVTSYLNKIYKLAVGDSKIGSKKILDQNARRTENQRGQVKNLSSGADDMKRIKVGSRLPTLHESVEAAARGELFED